MADISIILPVYNAGQWLDDCVSSVQAQTFQGSLQLAIFNDASDDNSVNIIEKWRPKLEARGIEVVLSSNQSGVPKGVGYAKNRAVHQSSGRYLCFLDADDVMMPERLIRQLEAAQRLGNNVLVGCQFRREPEGSTERYTRWANSISTQQLYTQVYTSHGPTIIMPTWFCERSMFQAVGGFDESGKGTPEDLIFFNHHVSEGGMLHRVDECLLMYRYHADAATFSVKEETIWDVRIAAIQERVINGWGEFTIWNAGKQGRHFFRSLSLQNQKKVQSFCDVDVKKLAKGVYIYEDSKEVPKPRVPIVHFSEAQPPFIICVKQDLTGGVFEENLASLELTEGIHYYHFN